MTDTARLMKNLNLALKHPDNIIAYEGNTDGKDRLEVGEPLDPYFRHIQSTIYHMEMVLNDEHEDIGHSICDLSNGAVRCLDALQILMEKKNA